MPSKPWRDLALDLLGPLPKGEYLLATVDYYSRWMEVDILGPVYMRKNTSHARPGAERRGRFQSLFI